MSKEFIIFTLFFVIVIIAIIVISFICGYKLCKYVQKVEDKENSEDKKEDPITMDLSMQAILSKSVYSIDKDRLIKDTSEALNQVMPTAIAKRVERELNKEFSETSSFQLRNIANSFFDENHGK